MEQIRATYNLYYSLITIMLVDDSLYVAVDYSNYSYKITRFIKETGPQNGPFPNPN